MEVKRLLCGLTFRRQYTFSSEPSHEIMVRFVLRKLILQMRTQPSSVVRCLIFGRTFRLLPFFLCANREGSGETEQMRMQHSSNAHAAIKRG